MSIRIQRAAVLGAGVMGAQIAAYLAAAGVRVHLLDLATEQPPQDLKLKKLVGQNFRSMRALLAIEQMRVMKPAPLVSSEVTSNIIAGNFADDFSVLAEVDWVIEAVVERPDIKKDIHKRISEVIGNETIVTTNTSGISVNAMAENFPEHQAPRFFATHFFNPPRYLHLVELIPHGQTDQQMMRHLADWITKHLGKGIVYANDTSNFIANRIGVFNLQTTLRHMKELELNIETVDALTGKLMGRPPSATFRTLDVVGLDTFVHTSTNVYHAATADAQRELFLAPQWINDLIAAGALGAKSSHCGCYKKVKNAKGKSEILAYRPESQDYQPQNPSLFPWLNEASKISDTMKRLSFVFSQKDAGAQLVWRSLRDTMAYAATTVEEIASGDLQAVDQALRWGFNWQWGPFELWQGIDFAAILERMQNENIVLPKWVDSKLRFYNPTPGSAEWELTGPSFRYDVTRGSNTGIEKPAYEFRLPRQKSTQDDRIVSQNNSASLLDIGDGIACLSFHSKMNAIDDDIVSMLHTSIDTVAKGFCGLVIANDGTHFSAGANLAQIAKLIVEKDFAGIESILQRFQAAMQRLKYAPFPTVAAPFSLTLGGGCEVAMHTSAQILAGETYAGLVEMGVGLLPAGGGTKELCVRAHCAVRGHDRPEPMPFVQQFFKLIGMAKVSSSGHEARDWQLFPNVEVSLSRPHQVMRAKTKAKQLFDAAYTPPTPLERLRVAGDPGVQTIELMLYNMLEAGYISAHDRTIASYVASILCGGNVDAGSEVSEGYLLQLERDAFVELCKNPLTQARIEHMLKTGKPLRN